MNTIFVTVLTVILTALAVRAQQQTAKPQTIRLASLPSDTRLCAPPDEHGTSACVDVGTAIDRVRMQGRDDCPE